MSVNKLLERKSMVDLMDKLDLKKTYHIWFGKRLDEKLVLDEKW